MCQRFSVLTKARAKAGHQEGANDQQCHSQLYRRPADQRAELASHCDSEEFHVRCEARLVLQQIVVQQSARQKASRQASDRQHRHRHLPLQLDWCYVRGIAIGDRPLSSFRRLLLCHSIASYKRVREKTTVLQVVFRNVPLELVGGFPRALLCTGLGFSWLHLYKCSYA